MEHSYLLAGTRLPKLARMLMRNRGISVSPKYFFRFLFLFQNSVWSSIFSRVEKIKYRKLLSKHDPLPDPVFIIGHWRTGSTFLHQLLNIDEQFTTPTVFQVSVPEGFMVSGKYYKPIMDKVLSKKRPMDNVKLGFNEPQEDEYALLKMTQSSPLESLIFPKSKNYFLSPYQDLIPVEKHRDSWKLALLSFLRRIYLQHPGKRIILKNPFHSMRIPLLEELFPTAVFIHIYRHPYSVIPSTIRMWDIVGKQNSLKKGWIAPQTHEVAEFMARMQEYITNELNDIPVKRKYELKFEDLESNPLEQIRKIYQHFGWDMTNQTHAKILNFLNDHKDYQKNSYTLHEDIRQQINSQLGTFMQKYGYTN